MEIYRCPITVAEGGKQLEIPLLSTCTAVRGTYSTASRVEWEEERGEEGRFNFCDANAPIFDPFAGIRDRGSISKTDFLAIWDRESDSGSDET